MSSEERKVAPLAFRNDQLVIVYDDLSPRAADLWSPRSRKFANVAQAEHFTQLVQDFSRMITTIDTYRFSGSKIFDPTIETHTASLLPVPLSQWIESRRGQRPTIHNTPLAVIFVLFFFFDQHDNEKVWNEERLFSSTSVTGMVIEQNLQLSQTHVHNVIPVNAQYVGVLTGFQVLLLSRRALRNGYGMSIAERLILVHQQLKRQGHAASSWIGAPSYTCISPTQALDDAAYCEQFVKRDWLYRVFSSVFFMPPKEYIREAAALSSIVSHGLCKADDVWSQFMTRGLYDPRLFMQIWALVTGDTLPNTEDRDKHKSDAFPDLGRKDKRRKGDDDD